MLAISPAPLFLIYPALSSSHTGGLTTLVLHSNPPSNLGYLAFCFFLAAWAPSPTPSRPKWPGKGRTAGHSRGQRQGSGGVKGGDTLSLRTGQ